MVGRPINQDRIDAIDLGLKFYEGEPHKNCGRTLRYASGGGCVHCARLISNEQREARKYLKHLAAAERATPSITLIIDDISEQNVRDAFFPEIEDPVDTEPEDGLDTDDDPDARTEAGVEDLM